MTIYACCAYSHAWNIPYIPYISVGVAYIYIYIYIYIGVGMLASDYIPVGGLTHYHGNYIYNYVGNEHNQGGLFE